MVNESCSLSLKAFLRLDISASKSLDKSGTLNA
jgi:hypothetical protein